MNDVRLAALRKRAEDRLGQPSVVVGKPDLRTLLDMADGYKRLSETDGLRLAIEILIRFATDGNVRAAQLAAELQDFIAQRHA